MSLICILKLKNINFIDDRGNTYDGVLIEDKSAIFIRQFADKNNLEVEWQGSEKPIIIKGNDNNMIELQTLKDTLIKIHNLSDIKVDN